MLVTLEKSLQQNPDAILLNGHCTYRRPYFRTFKPEEIPGVGSQTDATYSMMGQLYQDT